MTSLDPERLAEISEGCLWCGGNGQLETYTEGGEVDESTPCVCMLVAEVERLTAEALRDHQKLQGAIFNCETLEQQRDAAREQVRVLTEALTACAKLNCAKGPSGKHYKDEDCGECTTCKARRALVGTTTPEGAT